MGSSQGTFNFRMPRVPARCKAHHLVYLLGGRDVRVLADAETDSVLLAAGRYGTDAWMHRPTMVVTQVSSIYMEQTKLASVLQQEHSSTWDRSSMPSDAKYIIHRLNDKQAS
jgi:hypothetical protein